MFVSYLALVLVGITWTTTDGDLIFTDQPGANGKLYLQEGNNAVLTWDYKVDNRTAELKFIIWTVFNKTQGIPLNMVVENKAGNVTYTNNALSAYGTERLKKEGRATLVIKDITFEDSTDYSCILRGETTAPVERTVKLIVTGHASVTPSAVTDLKEGGDATFTCSATGVPSQNFTWKREGQNIVSNSKYEITSDTGSSQLTIKNISNSDDRGYYKCNATVNVTQPSYDRGYLGKTFIKEDTDLCPKGGHNAPMNKTTTICCPVLGVPPPDVTWKLPNGTELNMRDTILVITPKKEEDFGNYTCTAENVADVLGPFVVSLKQEVIIVNSGTELKQGEKFEFNPVEGALYYLITVFGEDIERIQYFGVEKASLEIPYNTLRFISSDKKPDPVEVTIDVLAYNENDVIAKVKEGGFPIKIRNAAATLEVSFISVIMLFIMVFSLH